jgi:exopolysaccharide biosynthesis operon protein EpsL
LRTTTGSFGSAFLIGALWAASPAHALWDDKLEVFVQENVTRDDNVFRLSDKVDAGAEIGDSRRGDTVYTTSAGFFLDAPYSLQRWQAAYTWYRANYRHFNDLDHDGYIGRASWLWAVTPNLTGDLAYNQVRGLSSFANIQGRRPDLVTTKMAYANAAWMMTASWRLHGVLTGAETAHTGLRAVNDLEMRAAETGLSFVNAQENRVGVAVRFERGRNPNSVDIGGITFDNEYEQESIGVQGRWVVTGASRFEGRADYTRRRYERFSDRDYTGPTFRVTHTWAPTAKTTVATTVYRDVAPLEDITASFVLVTGISIKPEWNITEKVSVRGNLSYGKWQYQELIQDDFEHRVKNATVSVLWRAARHITLSGQLMREVRTSSLPLGDYKVDTAMVEAHVGF